MKAPDKIYLQVCGDCPQTDCVTCKFEDLEGVTWNEDRIFPKDVEYTRTDAIIEKAAEYLYEYNQNMVKKYGAKAVLSCSEFTINVEDFKKAMKL